MVRNERVRLPGVGDVLRIESFPDEDVLVYYVVASESEGPFIEVYRGPRSEGPVKSLEDYTKVFGPVLCGVNPPVRSGQWVKVGRVDVPESYQLPYFLAYNGGNPPYDPPFWYLVNVNAGEERKLGDHVPSEFRELELLTISPGEIIEGRIRTGITETYASTMSEYDPLGIPENELETDSNEASQGRWSFKDGVVYDLNVFDHYIRLNESEGSL